MKTYRFHFPVLIIAMAMMTLVSCSDVGGSMDENSSHGDIVTLTTQLSSKSGVLTRGTMTDTGAGITSAWEVGDDVWVHYELATDPDGDATGVARATVTAVNPTTKAATISVDLINPKEGNTGIRFGHPYAFWNNSLDPHTGQNGTLDNINTTHGAIHGDGTLTITGGTASLTGGVTMLHDVCIWKLTFKVGDANITSDITKLVIHLGGNNEYVVNPSSQSTIYVALNPTTDATVTVTAKTDAGFFSMAKTGVTLAAGKVYTSSGLTLAPPVAMANATTNEIGKTLASDKYIYPTAAAAKASGAKACAVVAYVGNSTGEASYTHGLALAMKNRNGNGECWKNTYGVTDNPNRYNILSEALDAMESGYSLTKERRGESSLWPAFYYAYWNTTGSDDYITTTAPASTSGWFLPSIFQWNQIVNGLTNTTARLTTADNASLSLLAANPTIIARGGDGLRDGAYWSYSEHSENNAWVYYANSGKAADKKKTFNFYIRSALAF